jgi:hypothetical protein
MALWQYRCKSCGKTHTALRLPEGSMYLRCLVAREWAWYEPSSFLVVSEGAEARSASPSQRASTGKSRPRVAARRRAPAARTRRATAKKTPRKVGKRR